MSENPVEKRPRRRRFRRAGKAALGGAALAAVLLLALDWLFPFPLQRLTNWPASACVTDRTGRVLLGRVGSDGQWRQPVPLTDMSPWLVDATIAVEDERFRRHAGVDPLAVIRAVGQNLAAGRVVSGASTLTMQICRMLDDQPRTFGAKLRESFRAVQLERLMGKTEILEMYLNMAPYGGNLRGVEAAAQAYFNKPATRLSLAEAALIAGLPQSPSRYRPDRHLAVAQARQRTVLQRMHTQGMITEEQLHAAVEETIVLAPPRRELRAPHAASLALARRPAGGRTTIDADLQALIEELARAHALTLPAGAQAAVVIIDISTGDLRALLGSLDFAAAVNGQVNGATALRSPGSALKPFIYAAAFDAQRLAPASLIPDVPIERGGWQPHNFDGAFAGEVTAGEALRRSLNVPAILVAESLGLGRCSGVLAAAGVNLPPGAADSAGLALVVGGVEVSLLQLTNAYATLGRGGIYQPLRLFADDPSGSVRAIGADACAAIDAILGARGESGGWRMWKTGTSSGRRDAWALGHNGRFAIGVWIGRFGGGGADAFVGAAAAEPLLMRLFDQPALRAGNLNNDRTRDASPENFAWPIADPLRFVTGAAGTLRILQPAADCVLLATSAAARIEPRATRSGVTWFLDGRVAQADMATGLTVSPGIHHLRCVDTSGASAAVRFRVCRVDRP